MSMCDVSTQCKKSVAHSAILCEICAHTMQTFNYSVKLFFSLYRHRHRHRGVVVVAVSCRFFYSNNFLFKTISIRRCCLLFS